MGFLGKRSKQPFGKVVAAEDWAKTTRFEPPLDLGAIEEQVIQLVAPELLDAPLTADPRNAASLSRAERDTLRAARWSWACCATAA